jgi:hypothetical protein
VNTAIPTADGIMGDVALLKITTETTNQIIDSNATILDGNTIDANDILNHIEKDTDPDSENLEIV